MASMGVIKRQDTIRQGTNLQMFTTARTVGYTVTDMQKYKVLKLLYGRQIIH